MIDFHLINENTRRDYESSLGEFYRHNLVPVIPGGALEDMRDIFSCMYPKEDASGMTTFVVLAINNCDRVKGGVVARWHANMRALEVRYISRDKKFVLSQMGRKMLNFMTDAVTRAVGRPEVIFLDVPRPGWDFDGVQYMSAGKIRRVFSSWGAQVVPVSYCRTVVARDQEGGSFFDYGWDLMVLSPDGGQIEISNRDLVRFLSDNIQRIGGDPRLAWDIAYAAPYKMPRACVTLG